MEPTKKKVLTERDQQANFLKGQLRAYVESITERDPDHKQFYRCPFCGDQEHKNSRSGAFSISSNGLRWKCFSCPDGKGGDIFDLIGYLNHYKSGKSNTKRDAEEYRKEFAKACEIFNLNPDFKPPQDEKKEDKAAVPVQEPAPIKESVADLQPGKFKDFLEKCHEVCKEGNRGYEYLIGRGFTPETIEHFKLGYDTAKDQITIPYNLGYTYYAARSIEGKTYYKPPTEFAGEEPVFNGNSLFDNCFCFVCESQLDAISLAQAGAVAVAVGGTGGEKLFKLFDNKKQNPRHCLILCLDNDSAGKKGQQELIARLSERGIPFIESQFSLDKYGEPQKDSNDLLRSNEDQLRKDIIENVIAAKDFELETGTGLYAVGEYKSLFKKHQTADKQRISTGYTRLDKALYGGFTNELYILSADTSIGKSAISCCLAQNIAASGIDVLYYALEMGRDEFIARGASMISREHNEKPISYAEILNYKWDENSQEFYRRSYSSYEPYIDEYMERYGEHLYFIEGGFFGKTALNIADTAENFKKEHNTNQLVIIVDYLQRLKADPEDRAQRDAMSITSAAVQILGNLASQKHNTVIAISSISNAQKGQTITDAAGKYSGDIGYTGGILLGWNWKGYTDTSDEKKKSETVQTCKERGYREMRLDILKQRSGERNQQIDMFYYPAYNYFMVPDTEGKAQPHASTSKKRGR